MAAWNERLGKAQKQIIDVVTLLSAHFEGVAESLRGEEAQPRAAALYNGIRNQCHTVNDLADISKLDTRRACQRFKSLQRGNGWVSRCRQALVESDALALSVVQDKVSKRAADIEPDAVNWFHHTMDPVAHPEKAGSDSQGLRGIACDPFLIVPKGSP